MAVTKIWSIKDNISRVISYAANPEKTKTSDIEQALLYAMDEDKTTNEVEQLYAVTGVNCREETAIAEMQAVQERYGKRGGMLLTTPIKVSKQEKFHLNFVIR